MTAKSLEMIAEEKELHSKIWLEADGSVDVNGEWNFAGSYSVHIASNTIGNAFSYRGSISKLWTKKRKSRWQVQLYVCGGEYGRITLEILCKSASSLKKCREMMAETIVQFEQTDRFKKELWSRILHPDYQVPILKEENGQLVWIATTWCGAWTAVQGKTNWHGFERPLGYGKFYYRKPQWEYEYPRLENNLIDWDNGKKVYKEPEYGCIEVSHWSISGKSVDEEMKIKIDEAIQRTEREQNVFHPIFK